LQSALLLLNDEGLVWSSIAANPALRKFRCVQPSRDGLRPDSDLFMETTPDEWEQEFDLVYPLFKAPDSLMIGIIAQCRLEDAHSFQPWLEAHVGDALAGIRRVCHTEPDDFSLQEAFVRNVALLGHYDLTFDLCFLGRQLPTAICLAQRCGDTQMVLGHCGVPDIAHGEWETWKTSITEISKLPNVVQALGCARILPPGQCDARCGAALC
jgi:predicted TIM-barrel fold metal-dependent hydrolase